MRRNTSANGYRNWPICRRRIHDPSPLLPAGGLSGEDRSNTGQRASGRWRPIASSEACEHLALAAHRAILPAVDREAARGGALLEGGAALRNAPGLLARLFAPGVSQILDRVDEALVSGSILGTLPDGSTRLLGGRAPGFEGEITIHDWRALMRLATGGSVGWFQAWEAGEWSSPDPVPLFALFMANGEALGETGRAKGPWRAAARCTGSTATRKSGAEKNIHAHYDLGNDFYAAWLDPTMTYSSAYRSATDGLEAAQRRKWDALAERIGTPGTRARNRLRLGRAGRHLAEAGARSTGISLSDEQLDWARAAHRRAGFPQAGLSRYRRASSTPSSVSRWSRRWAANTGRPSWIAWRAT